jgi:hypothetical protein
MKTNLILTLKLILLTSMYNTLLTIDIAEMNLLYQFEDLVTDQFAYLPERVFNFLERLQNNLDAIKLITTKNEKELTDFVCFLEWNGNNKSPHYLDNVTYLEKLFKIQYLAHVAQRDLMTDEVAKSTAKANLVEIINKLFKDLPALVQKLKDTNLNLELPEKNKVLEEATWKNIITTIEGPFIKGELAAFDSDANKFLGITKNILRNIQSIEGSDFTIEIRKVKDACRSAVASFFELISEGKGGQENAEKASNEIFEACRVREAFENKDLTKFVTELKEFENKLQNAKNKIEAAQKKLSELAKNENNHKKVTEEEKKVAEEEKKAAEAEKKTAEAEIEKILLLIKSKLIDMIKQIYNSFKEQIKITTLDEVIKQLPMIETDSEFKKDTEIRIKIIDMVKNLEIFKSERYTSIIVPKKSGVRRLPLYTNPKYVIDYVNKVEMPKPAKKAAAPTQTIFFAYDTTKYTNFFPKNNYFVFGAAEMTTKDGKTEAAFEGQNFLVTFLEEKVGQGNGQKFVVIATHFKAKAAGFESRQKLGDQIFDFVRTLRSASFDPTQPTDFFYLFRTHHQKFKENLDSFKDCVIVLVGDLNSEVDEVAFHLKSKILRLYSQFNLNSDKLEVPAIAKNESGYASLHDGKGTGEEKESIKLPFIDDASHQFYSSFQDETLIKTFNIFDKDATKNAKLMRKNNYQPIWIETNNFPTERKVRLKELDYNGLAYNNLLEYIKQKGSTDDKYKCKDLADTNNRKLVPKRTIEDIKADFKYKMIKRFERVGDFLDTLDCFRKRFKEKKNKEDKEFVALYEAFVSSQFEIEKIDFILINSRQNVKVTNVDSVKDYALNFSYGAPNFGYGSDHFPSKVTIAIDEWKKEYEKMDETPFEETLKDTKLDPTKIPDWVDMRHQFILPVKIPETHPQCPKEISARLIL